MSSPARLTPYVGATAADPTTAAAVVYTGWTGPEPAGYIVLSNTSTTDPVYLVTADDETESGRAVPAGATVAFGPYAKGQTLWIVGADASPVYYSFDAIYSEGR